MKGNIAGLMQQAQKMQQEMQKAQEELATLEVTGQAGGGMVTVVMNGQHAVRQVCRFSCFCTTAYGQKQSLQH